MAEREREREREGERERERERVTPNCIEKVQRLSWYLHFTYRIGGNCFVFFFSRAKLQYPLLVKSEIWSV